MGERGISEPVKLVGVGASEGAMVGPVFVHVAGELEPERESIPEVEAELERFRVAVEAEDALSWEAEGVRPPYGVPVYGARRAIFGG